MSAKKPTHVVTHRHGWRVELHIPEDTLERLGSRQRIDRAKARSAICSSFRKACMKEHESFKLEYIEWHDLVLNPLDSALVLKFPMRASVQPRRRP